SRLPIPEVIPQRGAAVARALLIFLPVGAELVRLERANRQADLPLRRRELDDFHRMRLADIQDDLFLVLPCRRALVEFRYVNQPFDAFIQLDERAEVRHPNDFALDGIADVMPREEVFPDVGSQL